MNAEPMSVDNQILAALNRIEDMLRTLLNALADGEEEAPEATLDGELMGGERDQSQSLG